MRKICIDIQTIGSAAALVTTYLISLVNHRIASCFLMAVSIGLYIYSAAKERNLFCLSGVLCLGFMFPLGLALLRISEYQTQWELKTWICLFLVVVAFLYGRKMAPNVLGLLQKRAPAVITDRRIKRPNFLLHFGIAIFLLAVVTIIIKGHAFGTLPMLSPDPYAYYTYLTSENLQAPQTWGGLVAQIYNLFLSKGWVFLYQIWIVPPILVFYLDKRHKLRSLALILIGLAAIAGTMLIVSRELYLMAMFCMVVAIYSRFGKKVWVVCVLAVVTIIGFFYTTNARGVSTSDINTVFKIDASRAFSNKQRGESAELPSQLAWGYAYLTCGYDNFNHLVKTNDTFYYGITQLEPLFVILQHDELRNISSDIAKDEKYQVHPGITIYTVAKEPYLDFGVIGVGISLFIWGVVYGCVELFSNTYKGILSLLAYAALAHHTLLFCFVNWMTHFSYLMSLGFFVLIYFLMYARTGLKKKLA